MLSDRDLLVRGAQARLAELDTERRTILRRFPALAAPAVRAEKAKKR